MNLEFSVFVTLQNGGVWKSMETLYRIKNLAFENKSVNTNAT